MGGSAVTATRFYCNTYNKESNAPLRFYACLIDVVRVVRIEFVFVKLPRQIIRKVLTCDQLNFTTLARQVSGRRTLTDEFFFSNKRSTSLLQLLQFHAASV
jgi:hypothetical protein